MALRLLAVFSLLSLSLGVSSQPWVTNHLSSGLLSHWFSSMVNKPDSTWTSAVTPQLLLMSKANSFLELPNSAQANAAAILSRSPGVQLRWMGDKGCRSYLQAHYDRELVDFYTSEDRAQYKRDLCRTAVLLREGGFYADLDVELQAPLGDLINSKTSFMSVYSERSHSALKVLMAAKKGSPVLEATLMEMRKWYRHSDLRQTLKSDETSEDQMGPLALLRGIRHAVREHCPGSVVGANMAAELKCGEESFQFHRERSLDCKGNADTCAGGRATSSLEDHRLGLFQAGAEAKSPLIGYSRGAWCASNYCAEEVLDKFANSLHVGEIAFWPMIIGFGIILVVFPNMFFGFMEMFMAVCDPLMGKKCFKFQKGM